jgi:ATP-dependent DNA helicase RecG
LEGTQQSGIAFDLKVADLGHDGQLLQYVREVAQLFLDEDPNATVPSNRMVWKQLASMRKNNVNWAAIS